MAKIRKFYRKKKNTVFGLNSKRAYGFSFGSFLHSLLPISLKFMKEFFVATDDKRIMGAISANCTKGVPCRVRIGEMFFSEDCYDVAKQLIEFVISHYGAKGAASFLVKVDNSYSELLNLLLSQYNFRQCACEKLWKVSRRKYEEFESRVRIRPFRNSDAASVAIMYNEALISHFRPSLSLSANSFKDTPFKGLQDIVEFKYILEDKASSSQLAYISISTKDNENYVLDIVQTSWYDTEFDDIIAFACSEIKKRNLNFTLYVRSRKYTLTGGMHEEFLEKNSFLLSQTNVVLIKDFYSTVDVKPESDKFVILGLPSY